MISGGAAKDTPAAAVRWATRGDQQIVKAALADIADKVRKTIRKVQAERQISILYTSHNMRDIEEVCDRVIFLHKGKVVTEGTPKEIVERSEQNSLEDVFIKIARTGDVEE